MRKTILTRSFPYTWQRAPAVRDKNVQQAPRMFASAAFGSQ